MIDPEHWFLSFGVLRNSIIHEGLSLNTVYNVAGSAYNGEYVWVGERVFREAIKMKLETLGHGGLWRTDIARKVDSLTRALEPGQ